MKRHAYEYVKSCFNNDCYDLLSENYINGKQQLKYKCPNGHNHSITYYSWSLGHRCPICAVEKTKTDIKYIERELFSEGYLLVTKKSPAFQRDL